MNTNCTLRPSLAALDGAQAARRLKSLTAKHAAATSRRKKLLQQPFDGQPRRRRFFAAPPAPKPHRLCELAERSQPPRSQPSRRRASSAAQIRVDTQHRLSIVTTTSGGEKRRPASTAVSLPSPQRVARSHSTARSPPSQVVQRPQPRASSSRSTHENAEATAASASSQSDELSDESEESSTVGSSSSSLIEDLAAAEGASRSQLSERSSSGSRSTVREQLGERGRPAPTMLTPIAAKSTSSSVATQLNSAAASSTSRRSYLESVATSSGDTQTPANQR